MSASHPTSSLPFRDSPITCAGCKLAASRAAGMEQSEMIVGSVRLHVEPF